MTTPILLSVLFGALLNASWNLLVKGGSDTLLDTSLVAIGTGAIGLLALPFLPHAPALASWPWLLASVGAQIAYYHLIAAAYRTGDMSYTYPLMRGLSPMLVALSSGLVMRESLSPGAMGGVALISCGVFALAFGARLRPGVSLVAPTGFAVLNAMMIATFTLCDGTGVRLSGAPLSYAAWGYLLTAIGLSAIVAIRRPGVLARHLRRQWRRAVIAGCCAVGSYTIALVAMTHAPVASVAALRETSIVFATGLSALVLKEKIGWNRGLASAMIALGAIAIRLA